MNAHHKSSKGSKYSIILLSLLGLLFFASSGCIPANRGTPSVQGVVVDKVSKEPVAAAKIFFRDFDQTLSTTNPKGEFHIKAINKFGFIFLLGDPIPPILVVDKPGYESQERPLWGYNIKETNHVTIELQPNETEDNNTTTSMDTWPQSSSFRINGSIGCEMPYFYSYEIRQNGEKTILLINGNKVKDISPQEFMRFWNKFNTLNHETLTEGYRYGGSTADFRGTITIEINQSQNQQKHIESQIDIFGGKDETQSLLGFSPTHNLWEYMMKLADPSDRLSFVPSYEEVDKQIKKYKYQYPSP